MIYILGVAGGLIIITIVIAIILVVASHNVSIETLKSQNRVKEIVDIFQDDHANIQKRQEALTALVDIGNAEAIKALLGMLITRNEALLDPLATQLPRLGPQIYPGLRKAFMKAYSRPGVLRVLVVIGPSASDVVLPLLKDPNPIIKNASLQTLDQLHWSPGQDEASAEYWIAKQKPEMCATVGPAAVPALLEALKVPAMRPGAIEALGEIGDVSAGWPLLELSKDPKLKIRVIKAIIKWKDNALPLLFAAIKEEDPKIQQIGLNILDLMPWRPTPNEIGARYWVLKHNWEKCAQLGAVAVAPLLEMLKEKQVQKEVISTLGSIGDETALDGLLGLLGNTDYESRKTIIESLGNFKSPQAVDALIQNLSDNNLGPSVLQALSQVGKPAVGALIQALSAADRSKRALAAETLENLGWTPDTDANRALFWIARQNWEKCVEIGQGAVDLLLGELNNADTCVEATRALIRIGNPRIIQPIIQSLAGKNTATQRSMAEALGGMGAEVVEPLLAELTEGKIDLAPVIQALGESKDERAARPLTEFLKESYPLSVRDAAALALGKIGPAALDPIFELLRGEGVNPRAAGIALGQAGADAQERLIEALKSKAYDVQVLVYALGKIPDDVSARAILGVLLDSKYGQEIQKSAQEALYEIGEPAIRPIIEGYVRYPDNGEAINSILIHFGPAAVEQLVWALGNSFYTRQMESIVYVLGEIGDERSVNPLINMLKRNNVNNKLINEALEKIWKRQRAEKEHYH